MRQWSMALLLTLAVGCGTENGAQEVPNVANASAHALTAAVNQQLAQVRRATARFHDVQNAIDAGYVADPVCVESPAGVMGIHFVNRALLGPGLDPEHPEALLYVPVGNGQLRLVAVEYISPILANGAPYFGCGVENNSCPPTDPPPAPILFEGVPFNGPMAGHTPRLPWHYDQHVWIWAHNPTGMFAQFNPTLSCSAPAE